MSDDDVRRARITVAYDGAAFHGFAETDGVATVVGVMRAALERVVRRTGVALVGAGRTDAGVHGWGQVVSVDLAAGTDLDNLVHRLNRMLAPTISLRDARWVPAEFSARFSAIWRHYRYHIWNAPMANPLLSRTAWHVSQPLSLQRMQLACDPLIGTHDFSTFCRRPPARPGGPDRSMTRNVISARWSVPDPNELPELLRFEIRANAFCHQMVRSITGTLVEVGAGRRSPGDMMGTLKAKDRSVAGLVAPAYGLCLWEVGYPDA